MERYNLVLTSQLNALLQRSKAKPSKGQEEKIRTRLLPTIYNQITINFVVVVVVVVVVVPPSIRSACVYTTVSASMSVSPLPRPLLIDINERAQRGERER